MSFLDGFKKVLMQFKKTPPSGAVSTQVLSGDLVRPAPVGGASVSNPPLIKKNVKVHQYNWILLTIALILVVVVLLFFTGQKKTNKVEKNLPEKTVESVENKNTAEFNLTESSSEIGKEKIIQEARLEISDSVIDEKNITDSFKKSIFISCSAGEFKILKMHLETPTEDLILNTKECETVPSFREKIDSCAIELSWTPLKQDKIDTNLIIEWEDLSALTAKTQTTVLPIRLTRFEAVETMIKPEKETPNLPEKKEESFLSDIFNFDKKEDENPVKQIKMPVVKKTITRFNCRKYASKAYANQGSFLGWVTASGDVYSPRCTAKIGTRSDNGDIVSLGGEKIGRDATAYVKNLLDKREKDSIVEMPVGLMDFEAKSQPMETDWYVVGENRSNARASLQSGQPQGDDTTWGRHQMKDNMGILRAAKMEKVPFTIKDASQVSTLPKDEEYVIRRTKPIPAVLAYPLQNNAEYGGVIPATAIVERNIYGGSGRTVVIPAGSLILGQATGKWPHTYTRFARVALVWDRLVRPDGAEFIFDAKPISGDAQGQLGVPGKGSTDYVEEFVKPMITSLVPAIINLISPTAEIYTRKVLTNSDGDLNILETGENTSKEKAKQEMIGTWNKIAHKLVDDSLENITPPFVVPAGTRITIYPQKDIMLRFVDDNDLFKDAAEQSELSDAVVSGGVSGGVSTVDASDNSVNSVKPEIEGISKSDSLSSVLSSMGQAAEIRKQQEAEAAAAAAAAAAAKPKVVANSDPLLSFDDGGAGGEEAVIVGKTAQGEDVYKDSVGYSIDGPNGEIIDITESEITEWLPGFGGGN